MKNYLLESFFEFIRKNNVSEYKQLQMLPLADPSDHIDYSIVLGKKSDFSKKFVKKNTFLIYDFEYKNYEFTLKIQNWSNDGWFGILTIIDNDKPKHLSVLVNGRTPDSYGSKDDVIFTLYDYASQYLSIIDGKATGTWKTIPLAV